MRCNRRRRQNGCGIPLGKLRCRKMCCFGMRWCPCGMGVALGFMLLNNSYVSFRSLSFYGKSCVLLAYPSACCHCPAVDSQPLSRGKGANFRPDTPPLTPVGPPWGLWGRQRRHTKVSGWPKSTRCETIFDKIAIFCGKSTPNTLQIMPIAWAAWAELPAPVQQLGSYRSRA